MWLLWILASSAIGQLPELKVQRAAPEQPVPFSHKTHAATAKLPCSQCHTLAEPGEFAGLPATSVCMTCHSEIKKDSAPIAKLAAFHKEEKEVPWAPVYRVPNYVFFNHKRHMTVTAVTCESCHGAVATRDTLRRERDIGMQACMECHRRNNAKNDCTFCHEQK